MSEFATLERVPIRLRHPAAARLSTTAIWVLTVSVSIYGALALAGQSVSGVLPTAVSIVVGLCLLVLTMRLIEGANVPRAQLSLMLIVAVSGAMPIFVGVTPGAQIGDWVYAHMTLSALLLVADLVSARTIRSALSFIMVASLLTMFLGSAAFSVDERSVFEGGRLTGVLGHPNITGVAAALAIVCYIFTAKRFERVLGVALATVVGIGSVSITSIVALAAALLVAFFGRRLANLIVVLGLAVFMVPLVIVMTSRSGLDLSLLTGRVEIWAWLAATDINSAVGNGLTFFTDLRSSHDIVWFHAHNQALMDFTTQGVPGIILSFLTLAILGFAFARKEPLRLAAWVILVTHATTEIPLFLDHPSGRLMLLGAFVLVMCSSDVRDILIRSGRAWDAVAAKDEALRN